MTPISIAIAVLYGIVLTGAHQMALKASARFSRRHGRIFWCLTVALPLSIMLVLVPNHALIGLAVAVVFSYALHKLRQHRQSKALYSCTST